MYFFPVCYIYIVKYFLFFVKKEVIIMRIFYTDGATSNNGYENASGGYGVIELKDNKIIY